MRAIPALFALALGFVFACSPDDVDDTAEAFANFPDVPKSGATQPVEVEPCYSIHLPLDMDQIEVQGIDSYVARYQSPSLLLTSDCGAYDTDYGTAPYAQIDVTVEGHPGVLYEYQGSFNQGDEVYPSAVVLHLTRTEGGTTVEHLDVAVFFSDPADKAKALGILASVEDVWP